MATTRTIDFAKERDIDKIGQMLRTESSHFVRAFCKGIEEMGLLDEQKTDREPKDSA